IKGPSGPVKIDLDYIRFTSTLDPSPVFPTTEFVADSGVWQAWNGASLNLSARAGFGRVTTPDDAFSGLELPGGLPVNKYPPPWHIEVALERPIDQNTAIGVILQGS